MKLLKDALLLSKYPSWNSKMLNKISFYSFLFFLILWMILGFLKVDLEKRYEAMPNNTFVCSLSVEENFESIDSFKESIMAKEAMLKESLNSKVDAGYSFITSSYTRKEKDARTTMYRYIFSTNPKSYIQTIHHQTLVIPDFNVETPGVLISEALALEWFGTENISEQSIYLTTSTFGNINFEAPILGVYKSTSSKSILFDDSFDQANSLEDTILATMSLANEVESVIPFGEVVLSEMYTLDKPITSKEYTNILEAFPLIQCKYYAVNQFFLMVEPLFTLVFIILISFFVLSTFLLVLIQILRWIDIRPIIEIEKIFFIKKSTLISKIFLSNIIKSVRDFSILSIIYLFVNGILYLSIGYFIPIGASIGGMLAGMFGLPILISLVGAIYVCNRRLSAR